jgi:hypothetical protein
MYAIASQSPQPLLRTLGTAWSAAQAPATLIVQLVASCQAWSAFVGASLMTGTASYWDATGTQQSCTLPVAGQSADVALSDDSIGSCPALPATPPAGIGDFPGPIQAMGFVVPTTSMQLSISAQAAYFVFGFGASGQASPWTMTSAIFQTGSSSGPVVMVGAGIGVPPTKWQGTSVSSSAGLVMDVAGSSSPQNAIGVAPVALAQAAGYGVTLLPYQHTGQSCGWLPDSTSSALDKRNVRDGHYPLWGPLHAIAAVNGSGTPTDAAAAQLISVLQGTTAPPGTSDIVTLDARSDVVPLCAMRVQRTTEMGPMSPYHPAQPCGCDFEAMATGATSCTVCSNSTTCPSGSACSYGYCEAM